METLIVDGKYNHAQLELSNLWETSTDGIAYIQQLLCQGLQQLD